MRVRGELHRLLQALAPSSGTRRCAADPRPAATSRWTVERLAAELAPYFAEHATHRRDAARAPPEPDASSSRAAEPGTFTARQRILDPEEDEDWMIDAYVDARGDVGAGPVIELRGVRR